MEKIKFDYLLEHIDLFSEMARKPTSYGPLNDKFEEVSPGIYSLDRDTLGKGGGSVANLFRKTVIGLYNDTVKEFKYTIPTISDQINKIVDALFKGVEKDFDEFDIRTFEDIFPNSDVNPHYDSAVKLAEAIVYGKYYPDFRTKTASEFANLQLPVRVKKDLREIMNKIESPKSVGSKLNALLQQRYDMIENPDDISVALFGPLDVVRYINGDNDTSVDAVKEVFEKMFIIPRGNAEKDPEVLNRQKIINSPEFREKLTLDLFDYYRTSDRSNSSSAMRSENLFRSATNMTKDQYSALRNEVADIIKELKYLNRMQRSAITKNKNPLAVSPVLKKYKESGEAPTEKEIKASEDVGSNDYLDPILNIWETDVKRNINSTFDPSKPAFINSTNYPGVSIPRKAVNSITQSSYNLITQFLTKYYNLYEENGLTFTADDFKTKIIDKIASLKTAQNEVDVLQSIYNGLEYDAFDNTGTDEDEFGIKGIENSVVRAVFDKPENEGKLQRVKEVIKLQLKAIEAQLNYTMERMVKASDKASMEAGAAAKQQALAAPQPQVQQPQVEAEPVQESVFSYMEHQLKKDNKFKGDLSQFKDRGFKKPVNYWHWLNK